MCSRTIPTSASKFGKCRLGSTGSCERPTFFMKATEARRLRVYAARVQASRNAHALDRDLRAGDEGRQPLSKGRCGTQPARLQPKSSRRTSARGSGSRQRVTTGVAARSSVDLSDCGQGTNRLGSRREPRPAPVRRLAQPKAMKPFGLFVLSNPERRRTRDDLAASLFGTPNARR